MISDKLGKMDPSAASRQYLWPTAVLDLKDDCLLGVFKHLDLTDLCAIADVCRRFRQNARTHFASSKFEKDVLTIDCSGKYGALFLQARNENPSDKTRVLSFGEDLLNQKLLRISKVLRNFGALVKSIKIHGIQCDSAVTEFNFVRSVFDLIGHFCSCTLIELDLISCAMNAETEFSVQPLLLHIQKLSCEYSGLFGRMLSTSTPELRELRFRNPDFFTRHFSRQSDGILSQTFPKLTAISFRDVSNVKNIDIEGFLKLNPQLRKIGLKNCKNIDSNIFHSIATHTPHIDTIHIDAVTRATDDSNLKYVGKLKSLKTLKLDLSEVYVPIVDQAFMPAILNEIYVANITLQRLHIRCRCASKLYTDQLIGAISRLKTLTSLWLIDVPDLKLSHILGICKQLKGLTELVLAQNGITMTADDLLEIIKCTQNMQSLQYFEHKHVFDAHKRRELDRLRRAVVPRVSESVLSTHFSGLVARHEQPYSVRISNGRRRAAEVLERIQRPNPLLNDAEYRFFAALLPYFYEMARMREPPVHVIPEHVIRQLPAGRMREPPGPRLNPVAVREQRILPLPAVMMPDPPGPRLDQIGPQLPNYDALGAQLRIQRNHTHVITTANPNETHQIVERTKCINAYKSMAQFLGQRRQKTRLLIRLNDYNPIAANISDAIIRQHHEALKLVKICKLNINDNFELL